MYYMHRYPSICLQESPDTDVFIIAIEHANRFDNLYFATGMQSRARIIEISKMRLHMGEDLSAALIGLHAFSGCDSVSAFHGKGKKKIFHLVKQNKEFQGACAALGTDTTIHDDVSDKLQTLVCKLYNAKCTSLNAAKYDMFQLKKTSHQLTMSSDCIVHVRIIKH